MKESTKRSTNDQQFLDIAMIQIYAAAIAQPNRQTASGLTAHEAVLHAQTLLEERNRNL